jgi:D-lactate dehydrogenase
MTTTPSLHILATTMNEEEGRYLTQALADSAMLHITDGPLAEIEPQILAQTAILLPFIHPYIGRAELAAMPALKLIATRSTGYDHIDLAAAQERGIVVANVPGYGETAVAEHTFALLLTLSRKIVQACERTRQGNYTLEGLRGFDLYGKTLGVVGAGAIGLHVVRIARGFGMEVIAYDVMQNRLLSEVLGFSYVSLDELLARSDIVSLHAPALPSTYHLINRDTLAKMKRGALLMNTARGSLVDTEALTQALETGQLGGAGLDALEGEEFLLREEELLHENGAEKQLKMVLYQHRLQRYNTVVITPHIAFNSREALRRILDTTIENVRAFLQGQPLNQVPLPQPLKAH